MTEVALTRSWFITGVSSGLGRALALAAFAAGDSVSGTVRTGTARSDFEACGGRARGYVLDVTDHNAVTSAVRAAETAMGGIDILVNNAGYSLEGTIEETGWADIREQFETNAMGPVATMKAVLPGMRARRRGLIVNVGSLAGLAPNAGVGIYSGAKLALESISDALAQEVEIFGISVMIVVPGAFRTELGSHRRSAADLIEDYAVQNRERRQRLAALSGHQRGDPKKAAAAILNAIDANPIPRRLVLGPDAFESIRGRLRQLDGDMGPWETVSRGTDLT